MNATRSESKRPAGGRAGRNGGDARRNTERKPKAHSAVATPATPHASDAASDKPGISTDCFNNLLSNFTQALIGANASQPAGDVPQQQLLCEMGKLFISSMMSFNQILQNHSVPGANQTATAAVDSAVPAAQSPTHPETVPNACNSSHAKESRSGTAKSRDAKPAKGKGTASKKDHHSTTGKTTKVGSTVEAASSHISAKKEQGNRVHGNQLGTIPINAAILRKQHVQPTAVGSHKKQPKSEKPATKAAGTGRVPSARKQHAGLGSLKGSVGLLSPSDAKVTCSPTAETQSEPGSTVDSNSVKRDFSTATTPNNVLEADDMSYIDSLASAEEQLNFNIYRFVDSCTNAVTDNDAFSVDKLGQWLGSHPDLVGSPSAVHSQGDAAGIDGASTVVLRNPLELLRAAFMGDIDSLKAQTNVDVNYVDTVGRSALHYASAAGSANCVEYLLASGVDVNLADKKGWTAIHIAVSKNYADVARVLINGGANIFAKLKHKCAPARLMDVYSPAIHFAAIKGNIEITQMLLSHGATVNDTDSANMTPLHYAAFRPNVDYVKFLLAQGAVVNMRDVNGRSPFHASALSGMIENTELMIQKQVFLNQEDVWSLTPYKLAELRNHGEYCKYLREKLNIFEEDADDINRVLASTIAVALQEPNADQIYRCISRIGPELSKTVFDLTMQIERNGGVLTADGSRRRTSGGIFFTCLRELYLNDIISKDDYNYIRAAENEKRIAKAKERRNKLKARV
ncbi:ankyrin repeat-containing protein, putative [Babesia ovis]|uniref:Ankyrin repeat-containing protein, putative n=1 Tax=Babesia ovis TaxID=5869 RepID=A0A9W5WWM4_BABOV|nr:ankyrin repeat-containing protein, putative [Babesia ovis]